MPAEKHDPHCRIDTDREKRIGFAEVIYCPGKTPEQLRAAATPLFAKHQNVLATRATPEQGDILKELDPQVVYDPSARVAFLHRDLTLQGAGTVVIVSAGTCDIPVAEEAAICAEVMGNRVQRVYDVGVAGLHRVLECRDTLEHAAVVIVVAGMEGALPSVVGGLVSRPVIAVPTSIGYGSSFQGVTALLSMLNSCAPGVVVVNIDNGFGAAFAATRVNRTMASAAVAQP